MVTFSLAVPPSTNNLFFNLPGGGRGKTKEYIQWLKNAGWEMVIQKVKPIPGPVYIDIRVEDKGGFDLDNILKPTIDLLVRQSMIEDDRRPVVREITVGWESGIKGMRVSVLPVAQEVAA